MHAMRKYYGSDHNQFVRAHAHAVGAVSYFFRTARGWLQPEVEFVYDICAPPGALVLRPMDGEVESFALMTLEETVAHMRRGEFKPNCAVVLLDFLIRRGIVTPDNEPDYMQIVTRLHGRFDIDKW
ncbi:hypothetical protein EWM64_g2136 [Hericium alpestre]|uniref:Nudix hydrolase domain-containing protein n=1 Tax=Hericium alpestre TaxID=135208 RepID=A0A4Z0A7G2_9AGAM|nr:hypothetical protein EWM64_g2136 [Hericium alpestre]